MIIKLLFSTNTLAKAIVCNPKLIILDEPLANLDINTQVLFLQDLRDLANSSANPISIIISSQLIYEVENIADNIIFIQDDLLILHKPPSDRGETSLASVYNHGENNELCAQVRHREDFAPRLV